MSLCKLPAVRAFARPKNFKPNAPASALAHWSETPFAAAEGENTITIFDVIGEDWWTGDGFTAKRASAALRSIGNKPVTVQINSPGGDMFEGIAIYNLLLAHPAKVTVEVMGWAASAASIIAMAGDDIRMGLGTFMMVHNAWGGVVGNRHAMREVADLFEGFDSAIADIYQARASIDRKAIEKMMDAETFMTADEAVSNGFADSVDEANAVFASANKAGGEGDHRARAAAALARVRNVTGASFDMGLASNLLDAMRSNNARRVGEAR